MTDILSIDPRDVFYLTAGLAFFGMIIVPRIRDRLFIAAPPFYILAGAALALSPFALFLPDPLATSTQLKIVEHATEVIVIISLTGAGLAIDKPFGWKTWSPVWTQLIVTMPVTMLAMTLGGTFIGLPLATAVLLAASLAPTDPVLARAVKVGKPTEGDGGPVQLGLTAEAGVNDGLAFPFVYLALALVGLSASELATPFWNATWFWDWFSFDLVYRVVAAVMVGVPFGLLVAKLVYSRWGDAGGDIEGRGDDAGLTMMAATFACYGLVEMISAYGFLAVFASAVAGRSYVRGHEIHDPYIKHPYVFSEQFESLLLALLLIWFGGLVVSGMMDGLRWSEVMLGLVLIIIIRPVIGTLAASRLDMTKAEKRALGSFGIRGMGGVFYLAYGASHANFASMDIAWRVVSVAIVGSIFIHGITASFVMRRLPQSSSDNFEK